MLVVQTVYKCNTNGAARAVAKGSHGRKSIPWDHSLDQTENNKLALIAYVKHYGITCQQWQGGSERDGTYYWFAAAHQLLTIAPK